MDSHSYTSASAKSGLRMIINSSTPQKMSTASSIP